VTVVQTGLDTATAGRLRRVREHVSDGPFCMTYGDAVSNVDITGLVRFHRDHGALATVTAVQPRMPFGVVSFPAEGGTRVGFREKPRMEDLWVNGGFFVIDPKALDYIEHDAQAWEEAPMTRLADAGQLAGYKHTGFWQCMDAPRDRQVLEDLWRQGPPQWKVW
jgi:glucose-1-phosphate cytidylyltransferase